LCPRQAEFVGSLGSYRPPQDEDDFGDDDEELNSEEEAAVYSAVHFAECLEDVEVRCCA
jgi:hypothetical protein